MSPRIVHEPHELRSITDAARAAGRRVAFVPTMGALHSGHLQLVHTARAHADVTVVSIFVNPTQFGPNEDFTRYPRDLTADVAKLAEVGVDYVFAPATRHMYPEGEETRVRVGALAEPLCGPFRPGHFEGVATVVTKLFSMVGPSVAVFGKKDYQQLAILRRVVTDLFLPIDIKAEPIVRETDGLALSSRNAYLSEDERSKALGIVRGISAAAKLFAKGERSTVILGRTAQAAIAPIARKIDYVSVVDPDSLAAFEGAVCGDRALIAVACHVGSTRLIDNMVFGEDPIPLP